MSATRDIKKIVDDIQDVLDDAGWQRVMKPLAVEAIKIIVARTRKGRVVHADGGRVSMMRRLRPSTIARRKRLAHLLSPLTNPGKSNLTFSGEMLWSIGVKLSRTGSIVIGPVGRRNVFLAAIHNKSRPFMQLAKTEQDQLIKFYRKSFLILLQKKKLT